MNHVGIDLGGRESQICVRSETGEIVHEQRVQTQLLGEWLANASKSRVVLESCAEAFAVGTQARQAGHDVNVVPATLVRSLGVGARGLKTDKRDARLQSELSCRMAVLPRVHIPSAASQELRGFLRMRQTLLRSRTMLINSVGGMLRTKLLRLPRGTTANFAKRVRETLVARQGEVPRVVAATLTTLETLNAQLSVLDAELESRMEASPVGQLLMTIPGVGKVTAAAFMSAIDDPKRFANGRALASYLGLSPGEDSSSDRQRRTGLTKAGPSLLRAALVQCGWSVLRQRSDDPLVTWAKALCVRRSSKIAVCAVARKLGVIMWAMWRDQRPYEPRQQTA